MARSASPKHRTSDAPGAVSRAAAGLLWVGRETRNASPMTPDPDPKETRLSNGALRAAGALPPAADVATRQRRLDGCHPSAPTRTRRDDACGPPSCQRVWHRRMQLRSGGAGLASPEPSGRTRKTRDAAITLHDVLSTVAHSGLRKAGGRWRRSRSWLCSWQQRSRLARVLRAFLPGTTHSFVSNVVWNGMRVRLAT